MTEITHITKDNARNLNLLQQLPPGMRVTTKQTHCTRIKSSKRMLLNGLCLYIPFTSGTLGTGVQHGRYQFIFKIGHRLFISKLAQHINCLDIQHVQCKHSHGLCIFLLQPHHNSPPQTFMILWASSHCMINSLCVPDKCRFHSEYYRQNNNKRRSE